MNLFKKKIEKPKAPEFNKEFFIDKLLMERTTPTYDTSRINLTDQNKIGEGSLGAAVYNFGSNQVVKVLDKLRLQNMYGTTSEFEKMYRVHYEVIRNIAMLRNTTQVPAAEKFILYQDLK